VTTGTRLIETFIRVTRRQIPVQPVHNFLREKLLHRGLDLDMRHISVMGRRGGASYGLTRLVTDQLPRLASPAA
jgi:hypothetical protein